jgi:uncharacterized protein (UPF0276 family)
MASIVTPVSTLFHDRTNADLISRHSDYFECRDHSPEFGFDRQILFHTDLQLAHKLEEHDFAFIRRIKEERVNLRLVSFHLASCYHDPVVENGVFVPGGHFYSRSEMLSNAAVNIQTMKKLLGPTINIAIENNNFYPTPAYSEIADPAFISELVIENDISLLYDIAHAKVSATNMNCSYQEYKSGLPLDRALQLHICKSGMRNGRAYDAHLLPDEEEWLEVKSLLDVFPAISFLTVEYYKEVQGLIGSLVFLKHLLNYE